MGHFVPFFETLDEMMNTPRTVPRSCTGIHRERVKHDHQVTIHVSTVRVPLRSAHHAVGISNNPEARVNALNT